MTEPEALIAHRLAVLATLIAVGLVLGLLILGLQVLGMASRRAQFDAIVARLSVLETGQSEIEVMQGVIREWTSSARIQSKEAALAVKDGLPRSEHEVIAAVEKVPEKTAAEIQRVLSDSDPLKQAGGGPPSWR